MSEAMSKIGRRRNMMKPTTQSFERRGQSSAAVRIQDLTKAPGKQFTIVNIPTPINVRLFPDADEIRLYGAPPSARVLDRERRLQKILGFTPADYKRRQAPSDIQMVTLLEDIRTDMRDIKSQLSQVEKPKGQEVYMNLTLAADTGLVHFDFLNPDGNTGIPAGSATMIPSNKLFSLTVFNDPASAASIKISTNVEEGDGRARLVLRPGEKYVVDWKSAVTDSLNIVSAGAATVIITGMT